MSFEGEVVDLSKYAEWKAGASSPEAGEGGKSKELSPEIMALEAAAFKREVDFSQLDELLSSAEKNSEAAFRIREILNARLGVDLAERLLNNRTELFPALKKLQENLKTRIGAHPKTPGSGTPLLERADLKQLMVIYEVLGTEPGRVAQAFDFSTISPEDNFEINAEESGIKYAEYSQTPHLKSNAVNITLSYKRNGEEAIISRTFNKSRTLKGDNLSFIVHHDQIVLPEKLQGRNIAKELFRRELGEYDRLGVDKINLVANKEVGSYAWAKYGFGWNFDVMKEGRKGWNIREVIEKIKSRAENVLKQLEIPPDDPRVKNLLDQYERFYQNPAGVTPQDLAEAGKDISIVVNKLDSETRIFSPDDPRIVTKGLQPMHIGKYAMLGVRWAGAIKISSSQNGEKCPPRELLEKYLASK